MKISLETADRAAALRAWPGVLARYAALEAAWERAANVVAVTPDKALELAAAWAAWVSRNPLPTDGKASDVFEPLDLPEEQTPERLAVMWDLVERHARDAATLAGIEVASETWSTLVQATARPVATAYLDADLRHSGVSGMPTEVLQNLRAHLPQVAEFRPPVRPVVSLRDLFAGWKSTAAVKPRTVAETGYILDLLIKHLGHEDAARLAREDFAGWRAALKADGKTNTTWNNRLSHIRGILEWGSHRGSARDQRCRCQAPAEEAAVGGAPALLG